MPDSTPTRSFSVPRGSPDPFGEGAEGMLVDLLKAADRSEEAGSNVGVSAGVLAHLINKQAARRLRELNATHATCVEAKRASSVGMGHRDQAIYDVLDPLCRFGWQDVLDSVGDDYEDAGEGFIEVVWDEGRTTILGLNALDGASVFPVIEQDDDTETLHYMVTTTAATRATVVMSQWGDLLELRERYGARGGMVRADLIGTSAGAIATPTAGQIVNSEVIHIRRPTARSQYQGYPDWAAAVPAIELAQCVVRHEFDFHFNRGVPELIFTVIGGSIKDADWTEIKRIFQAQQGLGNSQKTAAFHFPGSPENTEVKVNLLGDPRTQDFFGEKMDTLGMLIATAHGIPPMLANVLLPGKIGAANEGPNALLLFQKRKLGQTQRSVSRTLATTLGAGGHSFNAVDGAGGTLTAAQFLGTKYEGEQMDPETEMPIFHEKGNGFRTVLDGMTLGAAQTMATMKEPIAGSGRNPADGKLGGASDRKAGDPRRTRS